ncbi:Hsp70 family protein [Actinomycetes bacterium KLBMP 9797]
MPYVLGIDIGGTTTAAAVARLGAAGWSAPETVRLGVRADPIPSVLHLAPDGALTVGEPSQPDATRLARGFSRRIGDDVPFVLGGEPCTPQALTAVLAMWVVETVLAREGAPAEQVVLSHPASWGAYRRELLHRALWDIGLANVALLPEPVLAAERHAAYGRPGGTLAVLSLGGNDGEASVVAWADRVGYRLIGTGAPADRFGGVDLDEAVLDLVRAQLGKDFRGFDGARPALLALRRECARAKERLSTATETEVPVHLPGLRLRVPVSRADLDAAVRPAVRHTVDVLVRTIRACGREPSTMDGVVLAGGATRMPLVAESVTAELAVPVLCDAAPEGTAAAGAARVAAQLLTPPPPEPDAPVWTPQPRRPVPPSPPPPANPPPRPALQFTPLDLVGGRR